MRKVNTFKQSFIAGMLCLLFSGTFAQERSRNQPAGGGGFTIGYGNMDVSALHNFVPSGVSKFSNDHLLLGGTGHGFIGDFVIGGSGFGIIGDKIKTDSFNYSLGGGLGTFDFGYLIVSKPKVLLFPMIGIGGGGYGIQISRNSKASVNEIVSNPAREINISKGGFLLDFSVNLNFIPMLNYDAKQNSYGGFMTGLKAGYLYGFSSSDWHFSGGDVTGGPKFGLNMFYVKLIIGGFGFDKEKQ